ncbi:MAG: hypothetical protein ABIP71_13675 [Verrucomicrobiota bacterium]
MKSFNKKSLWIWAVLLFLSLSMVWYFKPASLSTLLFEVAIIGLSSFLCGFVLAIKRFKTFKSRFLGGIFFAGSSLFMVSNIAFLGCFSPPAHRDTPKQLRDRALQQKAFIAQNVSPRAPETDSSMIDLTPFYNQLLPGQNGLKFPNIRSLEPGIHIWNNSKFDVRGEISLHRPEERKVEGIPVKQKCSGIDFLHGVYSIANSDLLSSFVIHYANGKSKTVPTVFGVDLLSSRPLPGKDLALTNSVTWHERIDTNGVVQPFVVFHIKKWENPFPNETIRAIDFVSHGNYSSAFLVAITLRQNSATKP